MRTPHLNLVRWPLAMRVLALVMAFNLFTLPQMLTAQSVLALYEECGSKSAPILEEEVLKHACQPRNEVRSLEFFSDATLQLHQYAEDMLDHPLLEVPHQPPKS
jgi:hypothetical protein